MNLTKEQLQQAFSIIASKAPNRKCSICGGEVGYRDNVVFIFENGIGDNCSPKVGGATYPMLVSECLNCCHVDYFNLVKMGIIDGD